MNPELLLDIFVSIILIAVSYTDLRWRRIPNVIIVPSILLAFVVSIFTNQWQLAMLGGVFGSLVFLFPVFIYGPERAGVGDVKLATFIGLVLSFPNVVYAIMLAFLTATLIVLPGLLLQRIDRKTIIPFGPFLAFGAILVLLARVF